MTSNHDLAVSALYESVKDVSKRFNLGICATTAVVSDIAAMLLQTWVDMAGEVLKKEDVGTQVSPPAPATAKPLLERREAAEFLTNSGFPTKPATLATLITRGGGPLYHKFGPRVLYKPEELLAWAQSKLSVAQANSSAPTHGSA